VSQLVLVAFLLQELSFPSNLPHLELVHTVEASDKNEACVSCFHIVFPA
jgi:hypothetical protein